MTNRRPSQRGVTMVELIVVVAIIGLFAALMFGVNSQTYGASATNVSDQLATDFNICKMRAVSTRRFHRCEVSPNTFTMLQWSKTGMTPPPTSTTDPTLFWQVVNVDNVGAGVATWDAGSAVCINAPCAGAPTAANTSLIYDIDFRPDGSSTGGTVYVTDPGKNKKYRVIVYKATGSSYARNSW